MIIIELEPTKYLYDLHISLGSTSGYFTLPMLILPMSLLIAIVLLYVSSKEKKQQNYGLT